MSHPQSSRKISAASSCSSTYPMERPYGARILFRADQLSASDEAMVIAFSLTVFSSIVWVPWVAYYIIYKYWRRSAEKKDDVSTSARRKRKLVGYAVLLSLAVAIAKPYATPKVGHWLKIRRWRLWKAWLNYVGMEVLLDDYKRQSKKNFDFKKDPAIFAIVPHGLFPFPLAFAALTDAVFGIIRPVAATATSLFPFVRELLGFLGSIDATKSVVDNALRNKNRVGLSPGGIAEMFVPTTHPNEEYALLAQRKGFIRMSIKHQVPIVPIYVFGGTKMFHRLSLPNIFEHLSKWLKLSLCIFYGRYGLPIPFKQKLLYIMGHPLFPPLISDGADEQSELFQKQVDEFHKIFCQEISKLFERHKQYYGWEHKDLCII